MFPRASSARVEEGSSSGNSAAGLLISKALDPRRRIVTDELPTGVRDRAMQAVDDLGGRVTVGDVAGRAGLQLSEAERALKALATDSSGFLEVSEDGDVLYVFSPNFRTVLQQRSLQLQLQPALKKAQTALEYVTRVTFGTALLVSIAVVYTAIFVLLTSSSRSEEDNRSGRGGSSPRFGGGPTLYFNISDLFWYWDPFYYSNMRRRRSEERNKGMGFFASVFSFVFGDGDPNEDLEERRWRAVGALISTKGGVVTAEELAPLLDPPPLTLATKGDESYMVPVLQRFDGVPEVDAQGNILYRFPLLQRTALEEQRSVFDSNDEPPPTILLEQKIPFSEAEKGQQFLAAALGVFNFVGVVFLSSLLRDPLVSRQVAMSGYGPVVEVATSWLPVLQVYAGAFFALPAIRWLLNEKQNTQIEERNLAREVRANQLFAANAALRRKLLNARSLAERRVVSKDQVIYSTAKDVAEQSIEAQQWEKQLQEREKQRGLW